MSEKTVDIAELVEQRHKDYQEYSSAYEKMAKGLGNMTEDIKPFISGDDTDSIDLNKILYKYEIQPQKYLESVKIAYIKFIEAVEIHLRTQESELPSKVLSDYNKLVGNRPIQKYYVDKDGAFQLKDGEKEQEISKEEYEYLFDWIKSRK